MKVKFLFRLIPLLSTLILVILLTISNKNEYTKLKILIWNTPSLSLGSYLAISTGAGFFLSYLFINNLTNIYQSTNKRSIAYKNESYEEDEDKPMETNRNYTYENLLIERDIKDPLPTVNASFRVIGKTERNNYNNEYINSYDSNNQQDIDNELNNQSSDNSQTNAVSIDWNDDSFSNW